MGAAMNVGEGRMWGRRTQILLLVGIPFLLFAAAVINTVFQAINAKQDYVRENFSVDVPSDCIGLTKDKFEELDWQSRINIIPKGR